MSVYELPHQGRICSARDCAGCQCRYRETILQHWEYIPLLRNGVVAFSETKDFHDAQFEYRWKSEWAVSRYVWLTLTRIVIAHFISTPSTMLWSAANWRMRSPEGE